MNVLVIGGKGALYRARLEVKKSNQMQHIYKYTKKKVDEYGNVLKEKDYYLYRRARSKKEQLEISLQTGLPLSDQKVRYEQYGLKENDERVRSYQEDIFTKAIHEGLVEFNGKNMIVNRKIFHEFCRVSKEFQKLEVYDLA